MEDILSALRKKSFVEEVELSIFVSKIPLLQAKVTQLCEELCSLDTHNFSLHSLDIYMKFLATLKNQIDKLDLLYYRILNAISESTSESTSASGFSFDQVITNNTLYR